jgi:mRNA-degrading endonuclease RelE of RelBE toxin-antitoxin system
VAAVELTPAAQRQIDALPKTIRLRLLSVVRRLEQWPRVSGAKPLRGALAGRYRIRTGDYRVQFSVHADTVIIEKVGHRDGFYEE